MSHPIVKVEISFFKPSGFTDTHWVNTVHRGKAIAFIMSRYGSGHLSAVNYVTARQCSSNEAMTEIKEIEL